MAKLSSVTVKLSLPYIGGIEGEWKPDEAEKNAAWEMYVELVTRVSIVELGDDGLLGEALSSLHTLFESTRSILRQYGPSVARPKGDDNISFGFIAVTVLNVVLRPVLAKWHPLLLDYEGRREATTSPLEHERQWERSRELRQVLDQTRRLLKDYGDLLAQVSGVPSLIIDHDSTL